MPRSKIDPFWVDRIGRLRAQGWKPPAITRIIEEEARNTGRSDWPSERTVGRYCKEFDQLPEDEQRLQALFSWPESMKAGLLPWEAARFCLDLVRYCHRNDLPQPTVRDCIWFWRLKQASLTIPLDRAHFYAKFLAQGDYLSASGSHSRSEIGGNVTLELAYQFWESEEALAEWRVIWDRQREAGATRWRAMVASMASESELRKPRTDNEIRHESLDAAAEEGSDNVTR